MARLVLTIIVVIFLGDLVVLATTERWWQHRLSVWTEILVDDLALAAICAVFLVPLVRGWQRRARLAERALDIASDGFLVAAADGQVLQVNDGYCAITGHSCDTLLRQRLETLQADGLEPSLDEHLAQVKRAGVGRIDTLHRSREGPPVDVQVTTAWLSDIGCYAAFVRDDSVRVAAGRARQDQAAAMQRLLDAMAEGVLGFDNDGWCTFANRAAARLLGYASAAALTGKRVAEFFDDPGAGDAVSRPDARGTTGRETSMKCTDGAHLQVECARHAITHAGEVQGTVLTFVDVGERVRARQALANSMRLLHDTFELAPIGMTRTSPDGRFVQVNGAFCRMLGQPRERLLALRWQDVTLPDDLAADSMNVQELLRGEVAQYTIEKRYRLANGGQIWALLAVALVRDEAGSPDYMIGVAKDIDARKKAEGDLRAAEVALRANAAKTEFLSRMSHELRTPLNAVLGYAQLLRMDREQPLTPLQAQQTQRIEQAGTHLLALINDVLDLARIEAGNFSLYPDAVELRGVAEESLAMVSGQAAAAGIALVLDDGAPGEPARALADRVRLRQVLVNLLSNAIKYNRPGGTVNLGWSRHGEQWELRIADTGRGLDPAQLAHLFEPFNRLGAERSGVEGTGIGLALSRHLTELMEGFLRVASTPGYGTVATLTLPVSTRPEHADTDTLVEPSRPVPLGRLRVLYAEDDEVNVELISQALRSRPGIELLIATDGAQALSMARDDPPDLMLVDMYLGDTTGLELGQVLRADPRTSGIRLVALSADALPEQIQRALDRGFEAYLTKPIDFKSLLKLLDDAAGG